MWTFNGTRIITQDLDDNSKQIVARLNPIQAGTIYHVFGWDEPIVKVGGIVVGDTDRDALKALTQTGLTYVLSGPEGIMGDYVLNSVTFKRLMCICQTMRPDLPEDSPVYNVDMELYYEP